MKGEFFKGACIAYILLGSVFFPKSAWAEEPLGTMIYHDIKDFGEYYDSESAITYAFIKGTLSSCSDSTNICTVASDNGKEVDISVENPKDIQKYCGSEVHVWYSKNKQDINKLISCSPETFWKKLIDIEDRQYLIETGKLSADSLTEEEKAFKENTVQINGTLTKYVSFAMVENFGICSLIFVETADVVTEIFPIDNPCSQCDPDERHRTFEDYIKLYEGMQINADVFKELNVAYHFSEA